MTSDYITSDSPLAAFFTAAPAPVATAVTVAAVVAMTTPIDFTTLALPLLAHQEEAVRFMLAQRQAYIGDEMGLGKTFSAIAAAHYASTGLPTLVICPPTLTLNWRNEIRRLLPGASVAVLSGRKADTLPAADWYVIGDSVIDAWYGRIQAGGHGKRKAALPGGPLSLTTFGALVIDEAHRFKTWTSNRTLAALAIANALPAGALRVLMSGTAILNRTEELAPQLAVNGTAGTFGGTRAFLDRYAPVVRRQYVGNGRYVDIRGEAHSTELNERMRQTFYLRRLRSEVLTLPGKGRTRVATEMAGRAATQYRAAERDLIAWLRAERGDKAAERASKAEKLNRLTALRRLVGAAKVGAVIDYVRDLVDAGEQVFVACWHRDVLDAIVTAFPGAVSVQGGQDVTAKQAAVDAFQSGAARVLVGNIVAAGVGITLTAAAHVVIAELPWHSALLAQVEDRLDRIGQTREVVSHLMIASNGAATMDDKMLTILERKAHVVGAVLDGTPGTIFADDAVSDDVIDALCEAYEQDGAAA